MLLLLFAPRLRLSCIVPHAQRSYQPTGRLQNGLNCDSPRVGDIDWRRAGYLVQKGTVFPGIGRTHWPAAIIQERKVMSTNGALDRKLRMALVGGGQGAFIGRVHATAAVLDNRAALVAGALSSDPAKAKASAADYDIAPARAYGSYAEMLSAELKLPE